MWYKTLITPPFRLVISEAATPMVINDIDPTAHKILSTPAGTPSGTPLSLYSPSNDAVYLNDAGYNTYLQYAFPNEPVLSRDREGGAMLPSKHYDVVRRNLDKALGSEGMSSDKRKPLGDIYDTVVNQAMPANPVGIITLRYPSVIKPGDTTTSTLSRGLSHEHIHRVQNELGNGQIDKHLNKDEMAYIQHRRPFYRDLYQSLRSRGYGSDASHIVGEGAAHIGSEGTSSAIDPYGRLSQDEQLRKSTIWISNYLHHLIEQHGPKAARAMFSRAHPDLRSHLDQLIALAENGKPPTWLREDAKF